MRKTCCALAITTVEGVWVSAHGGVGLGTAIYRFYGQGCDQGQNLSWSLILKTLRPAQDNTNLSAWNYYKREADAYQLDWQDNLPGDLAAPRYFIITEYPDVTCRIWLEDISEEIGSQWPLDHFNVVACHAG